MPGVAEHVDRFLQPIDPRGAFVKAANLIANHSQTSSDVRGALGEINAWASKPIHTGHATASGARARKSIPGCPEVLTRFMAAGYARALETMRQPDAFDKLASTVRNGAGLSERVHKVLGRTEPDFMTHLFNEVEARSAADKGFATFLDEKAKELGQLLPAMPKQMRITKPKRSPRARAGDAGTGGQDSICSVPSGSTLGDILCIALIVGVFVAIVVAK
jgi:hypothetical protein